MSGNDASAVQRDVTTQLGFHLRVAQAAVWRDLVATFSPFEIRPQQYAAMTTIERFPGLTLEALARRLRIKPPNLVGMVDDLENRGLVDRRRDTTSRRNKQLDLTRRGAELLQELKVADERHEDALLRMFGRARLVELLHDLAMLADFGSADAEAASRTARRA